MTEGNSPRTRSAGAPRSSLPRKRADRSRIWIGSALASVFLAIAAIAYLLTGDETPPLQPAAPVTAQTAPPAPSDPSAAMIASPTPSAAQVVDDPSGQLLWAPPTDGAPISLAYVPAGTQCLLHVRPASVANGPEGERLVAALGPWGRTTVDRLQTTLGSDWTEIESLLVAVTVNDDHQLEATLRAEFATPLDGAALAGRFPAARRTELAGLTMYTQDGRAYFVAQGPAPVLVVTSVALAAELIESAGDAPPLVRDIDALVEHTDADRDVTLIVAPKFLQASGHELLAADAEPLHDALRWLLGDDATAIALSVDWGDNFFAELRATPALNIPPRRLAAKLRDRVAAMPAAVEEMVLAESWHVYGRKVIARLPGMLRTLAHYTRAGEEAGEAIVRSYLPSAAGHNLLMAGELFLTQPHGDGAAHFAPNDAGPRLRVSVAEKLAAKTSLSFTKESLEQALALLAEDVGVEIVIAGGDLQLDGITKNQSLGLDLRDRPASEILLEILLRANPDRQATGPGDPRQKLVYVIEPTTTGAAERIIVTTRTAAAKRGDQLPEPFRAPSR